MKNSARYVVTTHWGSFSLDERAYRDYLAGKLWISWVPGQSQKAPTSDNSVPPDVSKRALALRDEAAKTGILPVLHRLGIHNAPLPYSERFAELSIDEVNLTVRSSNGLKRANAATFGRVRELLASESGILSVRNLGQKSAQEITQLFFTECYARLLPYEQASYWQKVLDTCDVCGQFST